MAVESAERHSPTIDDAWLWVAVVAAAVVAGERWGAAGAALAALTAVAIAVPRAGGPLLPVAAALCTAGAGQIHFAVAAPHLREWWAYGVFFLGSGWAQLAWAALAPRRADRRLLAIGVLGNVLVVLLWIVSRTAGLPFGPEPGTPETVGAADAIATGLELTAAAACALALTRPPARRSALVLWALALPAAGTIAYGLVAAAAVH